MHTQCTRAWVYIDPLINNSVPKSNNVCIIMLAIQLVFKVSIRTVYIIRIPCLLFCSCVMSSASYPNFLRGCVEGLVSTHIRDGSLCMAIWTWLTPAFDPTLNSTLWYSELYYCNNLLRRRFVLFCLLRWRLQVAVEMSAFLLKEKFWLGSRINTQHESFSVWQSMTTCALGIWQWLGMKGKGGLWYDPHALILI